MTGYRFPAAVVAATAALSMALPAQAVAPPGPTPSVPRLTAAPPTLPAASPRPSAFVNRGMVYQLQNYRGGTLAEVAAQRAGTAVVDLARDGAGDWFTAAEIASVRRTGKRVFAYFEIGSIENYRPEYAAARAANLRLSALPDWPGEYWGKYWAEDWWRTVVKPRLDRALTTGYDGVYLDTIIAYEELPLRDAGGLTRAQLAARMSGLIGRISSYAKSIRPGFLIVPQNAPELRTQPGYLRAIDGFAQEDLFYSSDGACTDDWCAENLANVLAIKAAGKFILAIDYSDSAVERRRACAAYVRYGFTGVVTRLGLDTVGQQC